MVGVHERAIFRERTQGKDLEGSLEGKASQEHDPAMSGGRDPRVVRNEVTMAGMCAPDLQHQRMSGASGVGT